MKRTLAVLLPLSLLLLLAAPGAARAQVEGGAADPMRLERIGARPRLLIGLGRCLGDEVARLAVLGPYEVRGAGGALLARGDGLPSSEVRAGGASGAKGVAIGGRAFAESPVTVVPVRDGTIEIEYTRDQRDRPIAEPHRVRYHGALLVHALDGRRLALVNEVDLEDYLKGVVGKEMSLSEGAAALEAQVIAARTYAIHEQRLGRLRRLTGLPFDLYDDERSQVYGGTERETELATRLVDATRGRIVAYEGRLVRTFYAAACGGATEPAWEVLGDEAEEMPPLGGRTCEYCVRRPQVYRWKEPAVFTKAEIAARCLPPARRGEKVRSVAVSKRLPGGHALEVTIALEGSAEVVRLHANDGFRRPLAAFKLRSTLFDRIEDRGDTIAIFGRGYGHGAGMCQTGAYEMAADGKSAAEILEYYFPGAKVRSLPGR